MTKTLPRLRNPTLDDIKRTATAVTVPRHEPPRVIAESGSALPTTVAGDAAKAAAESPPPRDYARFAAAKRTVARYRTWSIAAAATPVPLADAALVSGVQVRMLAQLAKLYGVPFQRVRVASLVSALFGGWTPYSITVGVVGAAARMAPGVGTLVGIATSVGTSALATEAIGKIFIRHFEDGGTFLDFEPKQYRAELDQASPGRGRKP